MSSGKEKDELLLRAIIKYVIPIFNKDNAKTRKKESKLEELVESEKAGLKSIGLIFLEDLISSLSRDKGIKKIKKLEIPDFFEIEKNSIDKNNASETRYSATLERKKEVWDNNTYSVSIRYEENETEEKISIRINLDNYPINNINNKPSNNKLSKDGKKEYFLSINKEKNSENKSKNNYSVSLFYENNYEKERLSVNYKSTIGTYLSKRQESLHDFTDRIPGKHMHILPESLMGGVLGFTYLGENFMARRADLTGSMAKMVDIHESIHTPDEYETRVLTSWIMAKEMPKYIK